MVHTVDHIENPLEDIRTALPLFTRPTQTEDQQIELLLQQLLLDDHDSDIETYTTLKSSQFISQLLTEILEPIPTILLQQICKPPLVDPHYHYAGQPSH